MEELHQDGRTAEMVAAGFDWGRERGGLLLSGIVKVSEVLNTATAAVGIVMGEK